MAKKKAPSVQEQLEELKEQVAEIRDATVDEPGKKSLPAGRLQRGVEDLARLAGVKDSAKAWSSSKDVVRAFVPTPVEALARAKLRGEDYEDAKAKAEESREDLENARPGLYHTGQATQGLAGLVAGIALYAKLAGVGGRSAPAPTPPPTPAKAVTKSDLVAQYQQRYGAAPSSAVARTKATLQTAIDAKPLATPRAPILRGSGKLAIAAGVGVAVGSFLSSSARKASESAVPAPKPAAAPVAPPATSYERTYTTGPKAGQTETVQRKQR